eukprot:scaffold22976_cov114-Isochrysis_galbana.AAC.2
MSRRARSRAALPPSLRGTGTRAGAAMRGAGRGAAPMDALARAAAAMLASSAGSTAPQAWLIRAAARIGAAGGSSFGRGATGCRMSRDADENGPCAMVVVR